MPPVTTNKDQPRAPQADEREKELAEPSPVGPHQVSTEEKQQHTCLAEPVAGNGQISSNSKKEQLREELHNGRSRRG